MSKFVISTSSFDIDNNPHVQQLIEKGFEVISNPYKRKLTEDEITSLLKDENVVGLIAGVEPLTENVLAAAKGLKVISRCGTGMDSVDLTAANKYDITVSNTPEAPAQAVAELTMGLILGALRKICQADRSLRQKEWPRFKGHLLAAQTVGVIGLGHIGKQVARLCQAFDANVIGYDPYIKQPPADVTLMPFENMLAEADIITLHVPYSSENHYLLDEKAFTQMKQDAIVVNAARGGLIDEAALANALKSGQLSAAALDSFEQEPYQGPLLSYDNIILTSHIGSLAHEARQNMEIEAALHLSQGLIKTGVIKA